MEDRLLRSLTVDWGKVPKDSYVRDIPALASLKTLTFHSNVTFFAGDNGTGKSTLLEALAQALGFNPEGGTRNYRFSTWQEASPLEGALRLVRGYRRASPGYFFRAESFYNVATATAGYNDGTMPDYHARSHGESFLDFLERYDRTGIYLMDEPEAALSPQRQLSLLGYIHDRAEEGSQFIIATHSPILLGLPGAEILSFDGEDIAPCAWEDTVSVRITRMFLERRESLLRELFREEE